jgi:predicted nuclease with RNAse H fold
LREVAAARLSCRVLTVGVDLAAEAAGTAIALLDWSTSGARLRDIIHPADDDAVIAAIRAADKAGMDCPLGWPDAFVSFVGAHHRGGALDGDRAGDKVWRRSLAWRHTDEVVRAATGIVPLSVAADRIGHTAMRCAAIQARLAGPGDPVDRSGAGPIVEVYPTASLKVWGLPWRGYKRPADLAIRTAIVDRLRAEAPWLDLGSHADRCRRGDHCLDAVIAALTARAAANGMTTPPPPEQATVARAEGWIALPHAPLAGLA